MEKGFVSPHWLVTTRITPSFPSSKTDLANIHSESNLNDIAKGKWLLPVLPKFNKYVRFIPFKVA